MRVVWWGTYDTGKPRTRILLRGLRESGINIIECHADIWGGIEDKSQLKGLGNKLRFGLRWLFSYPRLIWRYVRVPKHDVVMVGYLGHLDVLVLWPFVKLRGVPVVWDAFLSLHNTIVEDRQLVGRHHPLAVLLYVWEWLACRAVDLVLLDTRAHGLFFAERFHLKENHVKSVFVGAEPEVFAAKITNSIEHQRRDPFTVLFYGQFIPLHGIETIVRAARLAEHENINWVLIGRGQEEGKIRRLLDEHPLPRVEWIPWVKYKDLVERIHQADVCLGIFGDTDKAARVIPNKVFQIICSGRPVITRDSMAIHELLHPDMEGVYLIPPVDPTALLDAVRHASMDTITWRDRALFGEVKMLITPVAIGKVMAQVLERVCVTSQEKGLRDE